MRTSQMQRLTSSLPWRKTTSSCWAKVGAEVGRRFVEFPVGEEVDGVLDGWQRSPASRLSLQQQLQGAWPSEAMGSCAV
jgi:hypothetical protein